MKVAICGAGIAGGTLAYWLSKAGHEPFLIERAPSLRTGGYVMDFWGHGYTVAERMGILPAVLARGYEVERLDLVGGDGRTRGGFSVAAMRKQTHGRLTSIARGDLAAEIFRALDGRVEMLFGDTVAGFDETTTGLDLALESGAVREADLLIGADGLRSRVRRVAFGDDGFEHDLGYRVAAFSCQGYRPRDELTYVMHAEPSREIARFALRDDRTLFMLVFRAALAPDAHPADDAEIRALLRSVYGGMGWETDAILARLDGAADLYYDRVSQIRMPRWSKGRVALIGDAGMAPSLIAGEGAGLGMLEAYVLAGELGRGADYARAFAACEQKLRAFIEIKQQAAVRFGATFVPQTEFGLWLRNQASRLMALPGMANLMLGASLRDDLAMPDYG
jgi:2-polyprenyl-6-methoxyphenol hydroxylase-like FAD-dependent oxidoreductase